MDKLLVFIYVGLGGGIGSYLRYLISLLITKSSIDAFPFGTFIVNIIGYFLIGIGYGLAKDYE